MKFVFPSETKAIVPVRTPGRQVAAQPLPAVPPPDDQIVVNFTNLQEHYLVKTAHGNIKITHTTQGFTVILVVDYERKNVWEPDDEESKVVKISEFIFQSPSITISLIDHKPRELFLFSLQECHFAWEAKADDVVYKMTLKTVCSPSPWMLLILLVASR